MAMRDADEGFTVRPIGRLQSELRELADAPRQGDEGAPDAWLELDARYLDGLAGLGTGDTIVVITWLDRAVRDVLQVHPRGDRRTPLAGIFATRSPHRPNPLGLHRVVVRELEGSRLRVGPIEAIDGTPVLDIKVALDERDG